MSKTLQRQFSLSRHAMDRMRERFPHAMKEIEFEQSPGLRTKKMYEFLWNASIENRVINDTVFMQYIREKYGYDKNLKFFANNDMLFIGVMSAEGNCIVTVVNRLDYSSRHLRPVEKKMQKKHDTYSSPTWARTKVKSTNVKARRLREYMEADSYND